MLSEVWKEKGKKRKTRGGLERRKKGSARGPMGIFIPFIKAAITFYGKRLTGFNYFFLVPLNIRKLFITKTLPIVSFLFQTAARYSQYHVLSR